MRATVAEPDEDADDAGQRWDRVGVDEEADRPGTVLVDLAVPGVPPGPAKEKRRKK